MAELASHMEGLSLENNSSVYRGCNCGTWPLSAPCRVHGGHGEQTDGVRVPAIFMHNWKGYWFTDVTHNTVDEYFGLSVNDKTAYDRWCQIYNQQPILKNAKMALYCLADAEKISIPDPDGKLQLSVAIQFYGEPLNRKVITL